MMRAGKSIGALNEEVKAINVMGPSRNISHADFNKLVEIAHNNLTIPTDELIKIVKRAH